MITEGPSDAQIIEAIENREGKIAVPFFDGTELSIYSELDNLEPVKAIQAVRNLLSKDTADRNKLAKHLLAHFKMMVHAVSAETDLLGEMDNIEPTLETVWNAVRPGAIELSQTSDSPWAIPTYDEAKPLYVVLDLNVPWDRGHSVVMSWEDGSELVKVGEHGSPVHDSKLGEEHAPCIFHCPEYELCTRDD